MAILSEDIQDITGMEPKQQIETMYRYIQYLKDQLEFWGANREKEIRSLEEKVNQ